MDIFFLNFNLKLFIWYFPKHHTIFKLGSSYSFKAIVTCNTSLGRYSSVLRYYGEKCSNFLFWNSLYKIFEKIQEIFLKSPDVFYSYNKVLTTCSVAFSWWCSLSWRLIVWLEKRLLSTTARALAAYVSFPEAAVERSL
jgi:hypothetical protein